MLSFLTIDTVHYFVSWVGGSEVPKIWLFEYLLDGDMASNNVLSNGSKTSEDYRLRPVLASVIFGALGASLSALLALTSEQRIPPEWEKGVYSLARPLVGATSGIVALLLAHSGIFSTERPAVLAALAFFFGFSERLIKGAAEQAQKESSWPITR
jgi:hypothetical protein